MEREEFCRASSMQYQVAFVKHIQENIHHLLEKIDGKLLIKDELQSIKDKLRILTAKSQQVLVLLQVMIKVRDELAYTKFNLERSIKMGKDVENDQKRARWLEMRLEKLLCMSKAMCHLNYKGRASQEQPIVSEGELSPDFVQNLSREQKQRLFCRQTFGDIENDELMMGIKEQIEVEMEKILSFQNGGFDRFKYDDERSVPDEINDIEDQAMSDDRRSQSRQSSYKRPSKQTIVPTATDSVDEYWKSDHHRFEWVNLMQKLDPLSWHSLAISYPDSFLKRGEFSTNKMPWDFQPSSMEGSDFDKRSLEKLQVRLQTLYQAIEDAAVNSVSSDAVKEMKMNDTHSFKATRNIKEGQSSALDVNGDRMKNNSERLPTLESPVLEYYSQRNTKLYSRPVSVILPVVSKNTSKQYPRQPVIWCDMKNVNIPKRISFMRGPKQALQQVPIMNNKKTRSERLPSFDSRLSLQKAAVKVKAIARFRTNTMASHSPDDLKWKRILELLTEKGIWSSNEETVIDSLKCLSKFGISDPLIIKQLRKKMTDERNEVILYEASKCLILLGIWDSSAVRILLKSLNEGDECLKLDVLKTINAAKNAQFLKKKSPEISKLIDALQELVKCNDTDIAFCACLSLGRLCVPVSSAKELLIGRLEDPSYAIRAKALQSLVQQMHCKDNAIIDALLNQISNANNWKHRAAAADLLLFIGVKDATSNDPEKVFDTLETLLWNHPTSELRFKVAHVINEFGMRPKAIFLVYKRLDDIDETIRANAIQMLSTLRMKTEKELKMLLDVLELDSSVYVRIQVLKAFEVLKWNDARIIKALQEREKGDGRLAQEARMVLSSLRRTAKQMS